MGTPPPEFSPAPPGLFPYPRPPGASRPPSPRGSWVKTARKSSPSVLPCLPWSKERSKLSSVMLSGVCPREWLDICLGMYACAITHITSFPEVASGCGLVVYVKLLDQAGRFIRQGRLLAEKERGKADVRTILSSCVSYGFCASFSDIFIVAVAKKMSMFVMLSSEIIKPLCLSKSKGVIFLL